MSHGKSCCNLNANNLASAVVIVMTVTYVICVAASIWWTDGFLKLMNTMVHAVDLAKGTPGPQVTISSFFIGLIQTVVYTYVVVYSSAWLYNKFPCSKSEESHNEEKC